MYRDPTHTCTILNNTEIWHLDIKIVGKTTQP